MVEVVERRPDGSTFTVYPAAFFYKVRYETDTIDTIDTAERTDRTESCVFVCCCVVCVLCVLVYVGLCIV